MTSDQPPEFTIDDYREALLSMMESNAAPRDYFVIIDGVCYRCEDGKPVEWDYAGGKEFFGGLEGGDE